MTITYSASDDRPSWAYLAATGQISGISRVTSLGYNSDIDTGSVPEDIWSASTLGVLNGIDHKQVQLPAAGGVLMELVSDSASDTAAGTGARTVTINYLDASYVAQAVTITMNGTTPVAVAPLILRVNNVINATVGSAETNVGNISLRAVGGLGATYSYMLASVGTQQSSLYTVPASSALDMWVLLTSLHQVDTTQRAGTFSLIVRSSSGRRTKGLFFGLTSNANYVHTAYSIPFLTVPAQADFWLHCENVSANNTAVTGAILAIQR